MKIFSVVNSHKQYFRYKMKIRAMLILSILLVINYHNPCECATSRQIPPHLIDCYKNGGIPITAPLTLRLLTDLIGKIEQKNTNHNIRTISTSILHNLRLDGIVRAPDVIENVNVLPYRASAFQFAKFSFIVDQLIPGVNTMDPTNGLTPIEICTLHFLISSTVDPWERGDEMRVCPLSMTDKRSNSALPQNMNATRVKAAQSRCPIEKGVIQTKWGDISAGTLISAVSAALEPQNVSMKDLLGEAINIDVEEENDFFDEEKLENFTDELTKLVENSEKKVSNVFAATLTGDIAELAIRQGLLAGSDPKKYVLGPSGKWNDSFVPRDLYMIQSPPLKWEMTDAETLAGIDGFIIANYVKQWVDRTPVRLSQIIESYYTNYGIPFDVNIKACNRKRNFIKLLRSAELREETLNFVHLLWLKLSIVSMTPEKIETISHSAVTAFENYWPALVDSFPGCEGDNVPSSMEVTLVTDHSWTKYETQRLVSVLTEKFDVSKRGSSMGLMHGTTGEWISSSTTSTTELFDNIANSTNIWTNRLDIAAVLTSIITQLENDTEVERQTYKVAGLPRVFIFAAPSSRFQQTDLNRALTRINTIRTSYSDVFFVYYTSDIFAFKYLAVDDRRYADIHIDSSETRVMEVGKEMQSNFYERPFPRRIIGPPCDVSNIQNLRRQYEDYIKTGEKLIYRIHPIHLTNAELIKVEFQGTDQGELSVCISRDYYEDAAETCKILHGLNGAVFEVANPCMARDTCNPIYFIIRARTSEIKCSDIDCRYPDHIRFIIRHEGLNCIGTSKFSSAPYNGRHKMVFVILSLLHLLLLNIVVGGNK